MALETKEQLYLFAGAMFRCTAPAHPAFLPTQVALPAHVRVPDIG